MKHKSVIVPKRGSPEVLQIIENDYVRRRPGKRGLKSWPQVCAKTTLPPGLATGLSCPSYRSCQGICNCDGEK
jgi:hypothetical protein